MRASNLLVEPIPTGKRMEIAFKLSDENNSLRRAWAFYRDRNKDKRLMLTIEEEAKHRTLGQNNLHRALMRIYSFEQEGTDAYQEEYHEGILLRYAPDVTDRLTGQMRKQRTHEMDAPTMSTIIEADFRELSMHGLSLENAQAVAHYWGEWYVWRGKQKIDPLSDAYATVEDYRQRVCWCEACFKGLMATDEYGKEVYIGHMAHIISKKAGGSNDLWNRVHLCNECHIIVMHHQGWSAVVKRWPHIKWRIEGAKAKSGNRLLEAPKEERKDLVEKT